MFVHFLLHSFSWNSYYASTLFGPIQQQPTSQPRPMKRQRLMAPSRLALTGKLNGAGMLAAGPQVPPQQQSQHPTQQQLQMAAVAAAATSPSAAAAAAVAASLGGYYGNGNGSLIGNGLSNGCMTSNGYINNNSYLINGEVNGSMSGYTNGQHVVGPFKVYSKLDGFYFWVQWLV